MYHALLRVPWWATLLIIVFGYLGLNAIFAAIYLSIGGIANAAPGSYLDDFFFSIQTMGTIGYGAMVPVSRAANIVVAIESVSGLVVTALATGLVFARFSQTRARVMFSQKVAIGNLNGVPHVMVRVGNERRGQIVDTHFRLTLMRTTRSPEGVTIYKATDLVLVRPRAYALSRAWMILHAVNEDSPLHGDTAETLVRDECELIAEVAGTDETSLQAVHANYTWEAQSVAWNSRLADIISETPDGNVVLDLTRFHEVVPST
jgi:inward rectifier potassium channel